MNMRKIKYWMFAFVISFVLASCSDDVEEPQQKGNPTMQIEEQFANVHFGDLLPFEVTVSDNVPLSTLTAILYFGEEEVSKTIVRTKENGKYSGTISVPYGKNIPDEKTLKFYQEKWGHWGCKDLKPHFQMIKNEMENRGFGKIGQANHLPKYTKELIHEYLKKERLGNL